MSYDPRLAGRPNRRREEESGGNGGGGSVRAVRERVQAARTQGQQPDRSRIVGLPQRPNQLVSQFSSQPQQRTRPQQTLSPPDSRETRNLPSPNRQWPLSNSAGDVLDSSPQYPKSPGRGPPPRRPPRPTSDELPPPSPANYPSSYQSDDVFSPTLTNHSSRPLTTSSAASEASSLGSIPDFPVPQPPMPTVQPIPRRQPSLGPPPSARRGPSSYYTQMSYVSPIAEEAENRSNNIRSQHGSFASSMAIPSNVDDFYMEDEDVRSDDDETVTSDYGRDSRASDHDDKSGLMQPSLVRQASLGRRTKPSLMTIKSVDSLGSVKRKPVGDNTSANASTEGIAGAALAARDGISRRASPGLPASSLSSGTVLDPVSSSASSMSAKDRKVKPGYAGLQQRGLDPEKDVFAPDVHPLQQGIRDAASDERGSKRRPPRLDIDAVRDAEARGSLTSLPELIRRATRLAANLDRGKTASRLGLDFWEAGAVEKKNVRRSGSLSDMLAAFPPPGEATPTGRRTPKDDPQWPGAGGYNEKRSAMESRNSNKRRRCCGMPMWTFVTLLIVLLFLIAAAVVIPVVLIVLPKMKNNQASAPQNTGGNTSTNSPNSNSPNSPPAAAPSMMAQPDQCDGIIRCENGGISIFNADRSCNCVCINGFTGKTCATQADAGCTTTNIGGTSNATIGSGIPRLLISAQTNFSVPLDPASLLSLFSNLSLSCTSENALVTFNGLASRSAPIFVDTMLEPSRSLPLLDSPHAEQHISELKQRQAIGEAGENNQNNQATPVATAQPSATPSSTPIQTEPISSNAFAIDFARIGVLLILQETRTLDTAANAQEALQNFLSNDRSGRNNNGNSIDLGDFKIDLGKFSIQFKNGTTIQAKAQVS